MNCNCSSVIDIIGIIVASIIPVLIMIITLCSEKRKHQEQLARIDEKNRIDSMPVIDVNLAIISERAEDAGEVVGVRVTISLSNAGNGTAMDVCLNCKTDRKSEIIPKGAVSRPWNVFLEEKDDKGASCMI